MVPKHDSKLPNIVYHKYDFDGGIFLRVENFEELQFVGVYCSKPPHQSKNILIVDGYIRVVPETCLSIVE